MRWHSVSRSKANEAHSEEANCGPQMEVICLGTSKQETQSFMKALVQESVIVDDRGMASGQCLDLSIHVQI